MAVNFQDYTQGFSSGETEEQRRRREEQERIQREQQQAMQDQQAADMQARQQADMQVQSTTAQPGETVTQIPPGMANPNPYGSAIVQGGSVESVDATQGGPVAPDQANIEEQRRLQQAQQIQIEQVAQQQPQMAAPVTPVTPVAPAAPEPQITQLPQPGPGVQVAGPATMPPQASSGQGISMPAAAAPQTQAMPQMSMQERIAAAAQRAQERAGTAQPGAMPAASVGSLQQVAQQQAAPSFESRFTDASTDLNKLMSLTSDATLTDAQKTVAKRQAQTLLNNELGPIKGKEELANMSELQIGQLLKSKSEEGSWSKLLLLGFVSPSLAAKEAAKLGLNDQWTVGQDGQGNSVLLKTRDGVPVEGVSGSTGKALSPKELINSASQQLGKNVTTAAETYIDNVGNRYQRQADEKGNIRLANIVTGARFTGDSSTLKRQLDVSNMARVDYGLATDLSKKHSGNVLDMLKEYELIKGAMTPEARTEFLQRYGYGTTVPGGNVSQTTAAAPGSQAQPAAPAAPIAPMQPAPGVQPTQPTAPGVPVQQTPVAVTPAPGVGGRVAGGVSTGGIAGMKVQQEIGKAGAIENIQVQGARSKAFNDILDTEVRPQAQAGDTVSSVRKQQFAIFDRPGVDANKLFGLYNAAAEGTGDQKFSIVRDIFGGIFKPEAEVSQRLAQLNLTPQEKSALMEYNTANQRVNAATLKQNAGPGAVSDAEQRANREANVDVTKVPALGAFNAMAQSQFDGDRARWKADWATTQPAQNALQLDKAWRKENQRLGEMYREIATQRAKFIADNGGTTAAVQRGYKTFPVPEYDPATETWKKTRPLGQILGGQ